jgi:DNA-binding transcriptional MerR regulator
MTETEFLGIGSLAEALGVSRSAVRRWEQIGWIDPPARVDGAGRRVYRVDDLAAIRQRVDARRVAAGYRRLAARHAA